MAYKNRIESSTSVREGDGEATKLGNGDVIFCYCNSVSVVGPAFLSLISPRGKPSIGQICFLIFGPCPSIFLPACTSRPCRRIDKQRTQTAFGFRRRLPSILSICLCLIVNL
ncbi:Uncharacterized protein APZ42_033943 [Daphnia magna]|uniref:Uncharacterized protein n=1 Tax=Daphnia magna TaxID=35525 RepID=A0A164KL28_9CRUS|nr:Uncharacterized protein APZ42_033943 [Daphnia magna]